jgi:hypothetical protein
MTLEATKLTHEKLTPKEFASLLSVGNTSVRSSAPAIPAEHSARLIALGYIVHLEGRLRMTTHSAESGYMLGNSPSEMA